MINPLTHSLDVQLRQVALGSMPYHMVFSTELQCVFLRISNARKPLCLRMSGPSVFEDCFTSDLTLFWWQKQQIPSIHFKSPANFNGIQVLRLPAIVVSVFKWYSFLARKRWDSPKFLNTLRCEPLRGSRAYDFFLRQKHGLQRRWNPFMSLKSGWRRMVVILNPSFLIQPGSLNYPLFGDQTVQMYGNLQELPLIVRCLGW